MAQVSLTRRTRLSPREKSNQPDSPSHPFWVIVRITPMFQLVPSSSSNVRIMGYEPKPNWIRCGDCGSSIDETAAVRCDNCSGPSCRNCAVPFMGGFYACRCCIKERDRRKMIESATMAMASAASTAAHGAKVAGAVIGGAAATGARMVSSIAQGAARGATEVWETEPTPLLQPAEIPSLEDEVQIARQRLSTLEAELASRQTEQSSEADYQDVQIDVPEDHVDGQHVHVRRGSAAAAAAMEPAPMAQSIPFAHYPYTPGEPARVPLPAEAADPTRVPIPTDVTSEFAAWMDPPTPQALGGVTSSRFPWDRPAAPPMESGGAWAPREDEAILRSLARMQDSEIPKLSFSGDRALEFGDWMQMCALKLGSISPACEEFWKHITKQVRAAHEAYLKASPTERSSVEVMGRNPPRLEVVERRLRPAILAAVPETVRRHAMSQGKTAVAEVAFRACVEAGPGTAGDREATLRAVTAPPEPRNAKDAVSALELWKTSMQRMRSLDISHPDCDVLAAVLRRLITPVVDANPDFSWRLQMFQSQHGIWQRPTMDQVEAYWRFLHSEALEAQASWRPSAKIKEARVSDDPNNSSSKGRGKKGTQDKGSSTLKPCKFFLTDEGCRRGKQCPMHHSRLSATDGRCFTCGSKQHSRKECKVDSKGGKGGKGAERPKGPKHDKGAGRARTEGNPRPSAKTTTVANAAASAAAPETPTASAVAADEAMISRIISATVRELTRMEETTDDVPVRNKVGRVVSCAARGSSSPSAASDRVCSSNRSNSSITTHSSSPAASSYMEVPMMTMSSVEINQIDDVRTAKSEGLMRGNMHEGSSSYCTAAHLHVECSSGSSNHHVASSSSHVGNSCSHCGLSSHHSQLGPGSSPNHYSCLLYTSPSPRDGLLSRMPSSA